jgi:hypothetical protein
MLENRNYNRFRNLVTMIFCFTNLFINRVEAFYRVCHGLRLRKQDDYFWVDLTTFELSSIFGGSWGSNENWLKTKIESPLGYLACPNL